MCTELEAGEIEFNGQVRHTLGVLAACVVENLPARQFVHAAFPMTSLYFPATQPAHGPPLGPVNPVLQRQAVCAALEAGETEFDGQVRHTLDASPACVVENLPARQSVHVAFPLTSLYFPATQPVHVPPLGPVNPALHEQSLGSPLCAGAWELVVHGVHSSSPSMENVFGPQEAQLSMVREALTGEK